VIWLTEGVEKKEMDGAVIDGGLEPARSVTGQVAASSLPEGPLKVGVLVDLMLSPDAGGHVKCWERIAEAAVEFADRLDLTVHFNGPDRSSGPERIELSPSVRYLLMPPVFSTRRLVRRVPDHTDLGFWHPRLARMLPNYDVIHTTDAFFCYARTATRFARRHGVPVVSSIHTNTPEYARITVEHMLCSAFGGGIGYRLASQSLEIPNLISRLLKRRLRRHLDQVTVAMASHGGGFDEKFGAWHCGVALRRGLDRALFTPERRDRSWFETRFGLPRSQFVVMYAGKLNPGKNACLLGPAIAAARQSGLPIHLFCAGAGELRDSLMAQLGGAVTLPGVLAQDELARAYASADLFAFPSMIDESGNAPVEAMAAGLPALLAVGSGVAARLRDCPAARVLPGDAPLAWAEAIVALAGAPQRCRELGALARDHIASTVPTWREVLGDDLLPVWQEAAAVRWSGKP
jgi:glycosyltransferase involved in cell wall biosynthesis